VRLTAFILSLCLLLSYQPQAQAQLPTYKLQVDVVERLAKAINYRHRGGSTTVGFRGTALQPGARGEAKVESKQGYMEVEVEFDDMIPASRYGREYLTYVMWAITPQGRPANLGEVILNGTKSKLNVTTELQAFGMIVSAEPYFAVNQPSDRVVLENYVRPDTVGKVEEIVARYELLEQGQFAFDKMPAELKPELVDTTLPLDLQQARNAARIAEWFGAKQYAPEVMQQTQDLVQQAEDYFVRHAGAKSMSMVAREAVQSAEDARLISIKRRLTSDLDHNRRALKDASRGRIELRSRLVEQLRRVFETRETPRGIVVSLPEGLFESRKATLTRDARERLSRVVGLILAHPGLRLDIEGGASLSRRRAAIVRDYLVQQGAPRNSVMTRDFNPDYSRSERVEVLVSGDLIDATRDN
jgi:outer membrane protein OmpA-like peptidoglycan-associated protein